MMTWHARNKSIDGKVRHVPDSKAWQHIDNTWPNFATEPRNVKLGLAIDGANPFGDKNNAWSTWPVLLLIYNLPPWLVTKKFFMLLSIIIPGPESVKSANFDVLITPLIEELQELWEGVRGLDILQPIGRRQFLMRAILMWTIHDFPGYGLVSGCQHQGYKACPPCGSGTTSQWSKELGKVVFEGNWRWMNRNHPYRIHPNAQHFNGHEELRGRPDIITAVEAKRQAHKTEKWVATRNVLGAKGCPSKSSGMKRLCAFWGLPYWEVSMNYSAHPPQMCYMFRPTIQQGIRQTYFWSLFKFVNL